MDKCHLVIQINRSGIHSAMIETENGDRFELEGVSNAKLNLEPNTVPSWTLDVFIEKDCEIG